jgi:hypothetical protein
MHKNNEIHKCRMEQQEVLKEISPELKARIQVTRDYGPLKKILDATPILKREFPPIAKNHYEGMNLTFSGLFYQAHLLLRTGLGITDPTDEIEAYDHQILHFDLSDLISFIHKERPKKRISEFGFETDRLKFIYQHDMGFYIQGYRYNPTCFDFESFGKEKAKEMTLAHIHSDLARLPDIDGTPHTALNCPYLKLI